MTNTRIRWTDEERRLVYNRMVEVYAEGRYTTQVGVLQRAQDVLPIGRRRKTYPTMLNQLKGWMHEARMEAHTSARNRKLTEVALQTQVAAVSPAPQPVELGVSELLEKLVDHLTKRVVTEVVSALSEQLSVLQKPYQNKVEVAETNPVIVARPECVKPRRTRVLIIGLKGQQVTVVEQKYPDIDFTFMTADEAQSRSPGEADCTIVMTKFINHSVYSKYRDVPNLRHCNGGVSDLSTIIHTIRKP